MQFNDVFITVQGAIADSCGIEKDTIKPENTLFNELGINSIDLIDILYTLEMEHDISLTISDIEKESRDELKGKPFEIDNVITDDALAVLKRMMPEIPSGKLKPGITVNDLIYLFTVESLCKLVINKIERKAKQM
ncbi:MAG: hypothetical protein KAX05_05485 [Bacteroidales bacterium]|nr:hypothetical protein [Bacteroidales bacterium]